MRQLALCGLLAGLLALSGCATIERTAQASAAEDWGCVAGTLGGVVIGGLAGSAIGSGSGQVLAVATGAAGGGWIGHELTC